ncbi:uncharacterized protein LOC127717596 [Mytilus californianus]|uniref:uncharacterized protein LOC127717596 n=1 Tax=Mytilus californianus TaxID=6549 RepID=UPI002245ABBC|nr:uncharacterized protein LOC127717596 [Mytilus californianus]
MINASPLYNIIIKVETKDWKRTSWFCLKFCFLPPSYFNHILVFFVKNYKALTKEDEQLCISCNFGQFLLNDSGSEILVICATRNSIAVQVRYRSKTLVCYSSVKNKLIDLVHSLNLRYRINITYNKLFKCSDGDYSMKEGRIGYDIVLQNRYFCEAHNGGHVSKEVYNSWMTEKEVKEENTRRLHRKSAEVSCPGPAANPVQLTTYNSR